MAKAKYKGMMPPQKRKFGMFFAAMALALVASLGLSVGSNNVTRAGHNGAVVNIGTVTCSETTFTAVVADPDNAHLVHNMRLVVYDGEDVHVSDFVPTDGSEVSVVVGPFAEDTTVLWRVFGGGERDYDQPLWDGHGEPDFTSDIDAYSAEHGFGFVVAGPDDPNPFTIWHEFEVEGCSPSTKDECKRGGWQDFFFRNQGLCIQFVNTGKDSR